MVWAITAHTRRESTGEEGKGRWQGKAKQGAHEWGSEWVTEWLSEWMSEWVWEWHLCFNVETLIWQVGKIKIKTVPMKITKFRWWPMCSNKNRQHEPVRRQHQICGKHDNYFQVSWAIAARDRIPEKCVQLCSNLCLFYSAWPWRTEAVCRGETIFSHSIVAFIWMGENCTWTAHHAAGYFKHMCDPFVPFATRSKTTKKQEQHDEGKNIRSN